MSGRRAAVTAILALGAVVAGCGGDGGSGSAAGGSPEGADGPAGSAPTTTAPRGSTEVVGIGPVGTPTAVGPPDGTPLGEVDRDAGISARLRDGSVVWFFGDTGDRAADGTLRYFVVGTAAWAAADDPTRTLDAEVDGEPLPVVADDTGFPPCPPSAPVAGTWPLAAVVQPRGRSDRVVVWMTNICLGNGAVAVSRGTSVGEWIYDPDDPPAGQPVQVTVTNPSLFPDGRVGTAASVGPDGLAHVFGCGTVPLVGPPNRAVPCAAARVDLDQAADPAAYEFWDGTAWTAGAEPAPLEMAPAADGPSNPPGPFSVAWDDRRGIWLMAYSPWPGFVPIGTVRTAAAPEGPWGPPVDTELPDCADGLDDPARACYAVVLQPWRSTATEVGLGWYDRATEAPGAGARGRFYVADLPLLLAPA